MNLREATNIGDEMKPIINTTATGLQITTVIPQEGNRARPRATILIVIQDDISHFRECGIWRVRARAVEPHVTLFIFFEDKELASTKANIILFSTMDSLGGSELSELQSLRGKIDQIRG